MKRFQSVKAEAEGHFTTMSSIARVILKEPATDFSSYDSVCVCALCDPTDYSTPGSSVHGILQARRLEWVAISSSRGSSWPTDRTCVSSVSCIGRRILYHSPTREAPRRSLSSLKSFVRCAPQSSGASILFFCYILSGCSVGSGYGG